MPAVVNTELEGGDACGVNLGDVLCGESRFKKLRPSDS